MPVFDKSLLQKLGALALTFSLLACAAHAPLPPSSAARSELFLRNRAAVQNLSNWQLQARVALKTPEKGFSAGLNWLQEPVHYHFELTGMLGDTYARLSVDEVGALLELPDAVPIQGPDAQTLLRERIGWDIPLTALKQWVRGLSANGELPALGEDGLPIGVNELGYAVRYLEWTQVNNVWLPARLEAKAENLTIKLSIHDWQL